MGANWAQGIPAGSTSVSLDFVLRNTDGTEADGHVAADMIMAYWRQGGSVVTQATSDLSTLTSAYAAGGVKEADSVNAKGSYRGDWPDAAFAAGADWVEVGITVSGCFVYKERIPLTGGVNVSYWGGYVNGVSGVIFLGVPLPAMANGTARAGSSTTIQLALGSQAAPVGSQIALSQGTGLYQVRTVTAFNNSTKTATVDHAWDTNPDNTTNYIVVPGNCPALTAALAVTLPANPPAGFLVTASYGTAPGWYTAPPSTSAIVAALSGITVTIVSAVSTTGVVTIVAGDDYYNADSRALVFTDSSNAWTDLSTWAFTVYDQQGNTLLTKTGNLTPTTGSNKQAIVELTAANTSSLAPTPGNRYALVLTWPTSGHVGEVASGALIVKAR